jgi:hypothetical protein
VIISTQTILYLLPKKDTLSTQNVLKHNVRIQIHFRFVDITGDGTADTVITGADAFNAAR